MGEGVIVAQDKARQILAVAGVGSVDRAVREVCSY